VTSFDRERVKFPDVAVHELGHSFGVLGDEYEVTGDPCLFNEPRVPLPANIAPEANEGFKWDRWFMGPTPVPTPETCAREFPVGAYTGAYNCDFLFRPAETCKMNRDEDMPFCPVCTEQVSRRIFSVIDPVTSQPPTVERLAGGGLRFELPVYDDWDERFEITWAVGDESVADEPVLELAPSDVVGDEWVPVVATVRDATGHIVLDDPDATSVLRWFVRAR